MNMILNGTYNTITEVTTDAEGNICLSLSSTVYGVIGSTIQFHPIGGAYGEGSHVEGRDTIALGYITHAEGDGTIAVSDFQHVQGKFNVKDTENKYAHIIGNGKSDTQRSNAHTVDWDGNAWFAGTVEAVDGIIIRSSSVMSSKKFKITVDDTGTLTTTEVVE